MYRLTTRSKRAEKQFYEILKSREGISEKINTLLINPREEIGAHKLKGKLEGKWSCVLRWNIRMIYEIDDDSKEVIVVAVDTHKIYG